jgi:hypothetical protein
MRPMRGGALRSPSPDDVGVHAGAADVLAEVVHDQQINLVERKSGQQTFRFGEEFGLAPLDLVGGEEGEPRSFVALVLDDAQAAQHGHFVQRDLHRAPEDFLVAVMARRAVVLRGAGALAKADDEHLDQAAAEGVAEEIGVGLDAVDDEDAVGGERGLAEPHGQSILVHADLAGVHRGADRHAERLFADTVVGEQLGLAFGCGATVAAHGGDNERFALRGAEEIQDFADDRLQVRNAAAADADGDLHAGFEFRCKGGEFLPHGGRKVEWRRRWKALPDAAQAGEAIVRQVHRGNGVIGATKRRVFRSDHRDTRAGRAAYCFTGSTRSTPSRAASTFSGEPLRLAMRFACFSILATCASS